MLEQIDPACVLFVFFLDATYLSNSEMEENIPDKLLGIF